MNKAQISWTLGIVAGLIAIGTGGKAFWNDWGWVTPSAAEEAHMVAESAIKDFRDEWKCDEYEEELQERKREINRLEEGTDEWADLMYEIERIERAMDELRCSRFEDFG